MFGRTFFLFNNEEQHGKIGPITTDRMMALVKWTSVTSMVLVCFFVVLGIARGITSLRYFLRRRASHEKNENMD